MEITLGNAEKIKHVLLNNFFEGKSIELEYDNINAKIKIDGVSETEESPVFTEGDMQFAHFINGDEGLEDNSLCLTINNKPHMLYMNIGDWAYEYRIKGVHLVLGTTYSFGASKAYFSQLEISQFLEDDKFIYAVKNLSSLSGEGAISRINSGLKDDKAKKYERRERLVKRLNSYTILYNNKQWLVIHKIDKVDLSNEERHNDVFYGLVKDIINYSFTVEDIIAEDKKQNTNN